MATIAIVLIVCTVAALAYADREDRRQRSLTEFDRNEFQAAFTFAPELHDRFVARGSMSRREFRSAVRLNIRRIDAELITRRPPPR
jgi:hypothetical protein